MRAVILDLKGLDTLDLQPIEQEIAELVCYQITKPEQVAARIKGFDIVITNKTQLNCANIQQADRLKYICVLATGTNVVDKQAAKAKGIPVSNAVAYGVNSVVQHVWSLILALHTGLIDYVAAVRQGSWQKSEQFCFFEYPITELQGKKLGIIGYGNLGKGVAQVASAFGVDVMLAKPLSGQQPTNDNVVRHPFDKLVTEADIISIHCPLTEETTNLFTADTFVKMKPTAMLINAARGGIVNEADLATALRSGQIAGAAVDVLTEEPPVKGNVLLDKTIPNLLITPHVAWGSVESRQRIIEQTAENIAGFKQGKYLRQI